MLGQCQNDFQNVDLKWLTENKLDDWKHQRCILEVDLK